MPRSRSKKSMPCARRPPSPGLSWSRASPTRVKIERCPPTDPEKTLPRADPDFCELLLHLLAAVVDPERTLARDNLCDVSVLRSEYLLQCRHVHGLISEVRKALSEQGFWALPTARQHRRLVGIQHRQVSC